MTVDRWTQIERIYHMALELTPSERAAFVRTEAGADLELVAEIEVLLAYDERPAAFTQHSALELAARALAAEAGQHEPAEFTGAIGSYEIVRPLGSGGMGEVYLARDTRLARNVALKVLRPDLADPEWIAAFRHEALAASALNHPNIVTIYEVGEHEGTRFIAAEYADGVTLRERLKHGPISAPEIVDIALQISEGLAAAHEAGVVHRDIKPDNVMLRADGLVKILDFGIATRTGSDVLSADAGSQLGGVVIGTTGYMSPEQRQGLEVDPRTDVWSLGVVMSEMATRHPPAAGGPASPEGTLPTPYAPELDELARLPSELARIVRRALSRERASRYADGRELARDLRVLRHALQNPSGDAAGARSRVTAWRAGAALVLVAATAFLAAVAGRNREAPAIASIGVMPLENAGDVRDGEYLADGIVVSLRSRLAQFSSIR